jgi:hypothetical protein
MTLIMCSECNKEISDSSLHCIHCGSTLHIEEEVEKGVEEEVEKGVEEEVEEGVEKEVEKGVEKGIKKGVGGIISGCFTTIIVVIVLSLAGMFLLPLIISMIENRLK